MTFGQSSFGDCTGDKPWGDDLGDDMGEVCRGVLAELELFGEIRKGDTFIGELGDKGGFICGDIRFGVIGDVLLLTRVELQEIGDEDDKDFAMECTVAGLEVATRGADVKFEEGRKGVKIVLLRGLLGGDAGGVFIGDFGSGLLIILSLEFELLSIGVRLNCVGLLL